MEGGTAEPAAGHRAAALLKSCVCPPAQPERLPHNGGGEVKAKLCAAAGQIKGRVSCFFLFLALYLPKNREKYALKNVCIGSREQLFGPAHGALLAILSVLKTALEQKPLQSSSLGEKRQKAQGDGWFSLAAKARRY